MATSTRFYPLNGTRPSDVEAMERASCELAEDLVWQFRERDDLYEEIETTLFSEYPIEIPEAYRKTAVEVRAPLAMHIATTITAALSVNPIGVGFKPVGFGDVYQANSSRREKFFEASWNRQEQEAHRQLFRLFMWSLAVKGEGILKTCERTAVAWADYAKRAADYQQELDGEEYDQDAKDRMYDQHTENLKTQFPYPITTTDVPPETFYYTKNENGITSAVEIKELPYHEALARFGAGLDSRGRVLGPDEMRQYVPEAVELARAEWASIMRSAHSNTIRCIEAWDCERQVILLSGPGQRTSSQSSFGTATLCKVTRHSYGDPYLRTLKGPYFHALGITTASRLPEHAGLSVLFGYLPLFRLLDSLLTQQANAAYLTGFPTWKETQPRGVVPGLPTPPFGLDQREDQSRNIEPGKLYPFDIAPVDQPRAGVETEKLISNIRNMLELALPSVIQGLVASDQSGYALNQAAYLARLSWDPIVSNAEDALGERTGFESYLIEHCIGETVYAWGEQERTRGHKRAGGQLKGTWLGISPEDLNGIHRYTVTLKPSTPSNEIIETRAIGEKMQLKLISYEDAVEQSGSNPDEVEKSWLLHDTKQAPWVQAALQEAIQQKVGMMRAQRIARAGMTPEELAGAAPPAARPSASGVPGTPGTPPQGPVGGMPANPVPSPGQGLPIVPPPGGVPTGTPYAPTGPPAGYIPLPGR
jgi:hypothetical protein